MLCWILSHTGIHGNEEKKKAKAAKTRPSNMRH